MSDEEMPDLLDPEESQDEDYQEEEDSVEDAADSDIVAEDEVGADEGGENEDDEDEEDDADDADDAEDENDESKNQANAEQPLEEQPVKRKRGRPPGSGKKKPPKTGRFQPLQIPLDENGNPYGVEGDELVLPDEPKGEEKVDKLGFLKGGREFRLRTFNILGKGQRQYMLATEPARCIGFRDSYLLFQRHRKLLKIKLSDDEKFDLIDREIIPHSYKGRTLGVVTARSIYREFGARVVVAGRRVVDDYYEAEAEAAGHTSSELADPDDYIPPPGQDYDRNQYCAWYTPPQQVDSAAMFESNLMSVLKQQTIHGDGQGGGQQYLPTESSKPDPQLVQSSTKSAADFNKHLISGRQRSMAQFTSAQGVYDPHTSVKFVPNITQPLRSSTTKVSKSSRKGSVTFTTVMRWRPASTLLSQISPDIYEDADEETKRAIAEQIATEKLG